MIDLSEDPLLNKDLRYLVVLQPSFRNPLLQELLLSGTHYQTPSPHWLRHHPSEAICLLHHARRLAHSIAEISVRRLAIIIQIQIQIECQHPVHQYWYRLNSAHSLVYCDVYTSLCPLCVTLMRTLFSSIKNRVYTVVQPDPRLACRVHSKHTNCN